jgi:hypothetical protein
LPVLAPERILVAGELTLAWPQLLKGIEAELAHRRYPAMPATRIESLGDFASARLSGAVALILQKEFSVYDLPSFQ